MIIRKQKVRFSPDRKPSPRRVKLGLEGDNMVERLAFALPVIAASQTATLMIGGEYPDAVQMATDGVDWYIDLTAGIVGPEGDVEAYVRIDGAEGETWQSGVITLTTGDVPGVDVEIERHYPTAVETMLQEMAQHSAEMERQAKRAEAAADRAEDAGGSGGTECTGGLRMEIDETEPTDPAVDIWVKRVDKLPGGSGGGSGDGITQEELDTQLAEYVTADEMAEALDRLAGEFGAIPQYVIDEAESVIDRIAAAQGGRTFTLAAITDMHYGNGGYTDGVRHACQALKYIDDRIKLDAVAVLGDFTDGNPATNYSDAIADFRAVNAVLSGLRFAPNLRMHGNHDYYEGHMPEIYRYISAYSDDVVWGGGSYFYRDFERHKLRIICLDTVGDNVGNVGYTDGQAQWFADALDLNTKTDAASWGVLVLSHHPIDFGHVTGQQSRFSGVIAAYVNGMSYANGEVSCDFSGKNAATFIGNIHGHIHNLLVGYIGHNGTMLNALRIATPEACYGRSNTYDGVWHQAETYGKQMGTGKDTSFVVYCIDLDTNTIKAVCYGAGYDRTITYGDDLYWDGMPDDGGGEGGETVTYTNQVPIAIDMDGNTVTNGAMYTDSCWSGSGDVSAQEGYFITGLIPIKPGDFVRVRWNNTEKYGDAGYQGVRAFGADRTPIETRLPFQYMFDPSNEAGQKFTAVDGFRYDREGGVLDFQALAYSSIPANTVYLTFVLSGDPAETIITVNEPIGD